MRSMHFAAVAAALLHPTSVSADELHDYNSCLIARLVAMKDSCEPADLISQAVVSGCNAELRRVILRPEFAAIRAERKMELERETRATRAAEMLALLVEYRVKQPCE